MSDVTPQVGDIAVCAQGHIGIIHSPLRRMVRYEDGRKIRAWVGKTICPAERFGEPWSSKKPTVLGNITQLSEVELNPSP